MKKSILLPLMILLASGLVYAQNSPDLAETLLWMHNFADAHSSWRVEKSEQNPMGIDRSRLTFNKCQVTDTLLEGGKSQGDTKFSLAEVDPQTVTNKKISDAVEFETTNSQDVIALNISQNYRNSIQEWCKHNTCFSSWLINFDSEENAKRFANAFKHAVSLCGGKPSTFYASFPSSLMTMNSYSEELL